MNIYSRLLVILTLLPAFLVLPVFGQTAELPSDLRDLVSRASSNDKQIALFMHSEAWDAPPNLYEVLPDAPVVKEYLYKYQIIAIDADSEQYQEWRKQFDVMEVYPSLTLLGFEGQSLGYKTLDDVSLESVLTFFLRAEGQLDSKQD